MLFDLLKQCSAAKSVFVSVEKSICLKKSRMKGFCRLVCACNRRRRPFGFLLRFGGLLASQ